MWYYYKLLQVRPFVLDDHLVVTLQVPLVDRSLVMNKYKADNLPIHPLLQKVFQYSVQGEYLALSSDCDCATIP